MISLVVACQCPACFALVGEASTFCLRCGEPSRGTRSTRYLGRIGKGVVLLVAAILVAILWGLGLQV